MSLKPVPRRSVTDDVFEQIAAEVLRGEVAVGEALPSERRLAEVLGVSRPSVREALKRLGHAGLVDIRQGDTTTVRDFRRHAGMDLLPQLLMSRGTVDIPTARSVMETRLHVGPFVARLAAERGGLRSARRWTPPCTTWPRRLTRSRNSSLRWRSGTSSSTARTRSRCA
jgi:DNA-binding FadR family transcriptional regulator